MSAKQNIFLVVWFYVGWFGCIFFGKWNLAEWSVIFPLIPFLILVIKKTVSKKQMAFLLLTAVIGIVFDGLMLRLGLTRFPGPAFAFIPLWLISMWLLFVTIIPISHPLFKSHLQLAAVLGAVFGPMSYYSGEGFGVFAFSSLSAILIYAGFWGIYFPATHYIYRKLT